MTADEISKGRGDSLPLVPVPLTPLIGRDQEVAEVAALLGRGDVRLVTLTGPGGVGKTRLALKLLEDPRVRRGADVCFVPLAPVSDPAMLVPTVAQALGIRESGEQPIDEAVHAALSAHECLLVLDNLEHLPAAWPAVVKLLSGSRGLRILATSRARLGLTGEHVYALWPLPLPAGQAGTAAEVMLAGAGRLFAARAVAADPSFRLTDANAADVAAICRALDGLPLAIELAAARTRVLPPHQLRERLGLALLTGGGADLPARQRTMGATIAWSHDLLTPAEQALFRRLAIFVGGWRLPVAEEVCYFGDDEAMTVLDGLQSLLDKSLVQHLPEAGGEPRFGMLETIREFALGQLAAHGEAGALRRRHAEAYVQIARDTFVQVFGRNRDVWLARMEADHDNLRAALTVAIEADDAELAQRLAGRIWTFWTVRGHHLEGRRWLERALAIGGETPPTVRSEALQGLAQICVDTGDAEPALRFGEEALDVARTVGYAVGVGMALFVIGNVELKLGRAEQAQRRHEEALAILLESGEKTKAGYTFNQLAFDASLLGQYDRAEELAQRNLDLSREMGDEIGVADSLAILADVARLRGDLPRATDLTREALTLRAGDRGSQEISYALRLMARLAFGWGDSRSAARWLAADEALRESGGLELPFEYRALQDRTIDDLRAALGAEGFTLIWDEGRALPFGEAVAEAIAFVPPATRREAAGVETGTVLPALGLSPQERRVLCLIAAGKSDRQIAEALFIQPSTARRHVDNVYKKLEIHNRAEATAAALRHGLCDDASNSPAS